MSRLPAPLVRIDAPRAILYRPKAFRRLAAPANYSPALARVSSVAYEVHRALDTPGASFHPATGFDGLSASATPKAREFLERWHRFQMPLSADFAAEYVAKDYAQYERLSAGVLWGLAAGAAVGGAAQASGLRMTEGFWGPAAEGVVRWVAGNGDSVGGWIATRLGRGGDDAAEESADEGFAEFREMVALRARRAGYVPDEGEGSAKAFSSWALAGALAGPAFQGATELSDVSKVGAAGALYASAYSNGDNLIGALGALRAMYARRRAAGIPAGKAFRQAFDEFRSHPFQAANAAFILAVFAANLGLRASGALPVDQHVWAAVEGAVLNLDTLFASLWTKFCIARLRAGLVDAIAPEYSDDLTRLWYVVSRG